MEEERTLAIGEDGRVFVSRNFCSGEEIEWTELFGEARKEILEALNQGPQDESLSGQSMS